MKFAHNPMLYLIWMAYRLRATTQVLSGLHAMAAIVYLATKPLTWETPIVVIFLWWAAYQMAQCAAHVGAWLPENDPNYTAEV